MLKQRHLKQTVGLICLSIFVMLNIRSENLVFIYRPRISRRSFSLPWNRNKFLDFIARIYGNKIQKKVNYDLRFFILESQTFFICWISEMAECHLLNRRTHLKRQIQLSLTRSRDSRNTQTKSGSLAFHVLTSSFCLVLGSTWVLLPVCLSVCGNFEVHMHVYLLCSVVYVCVFSRVCLHMWLTIIAEPFLGQPDKWFGGLVLFESMSSAFTVHDVLTLNV